LGVNDGVVKRNAATQTSKQTNKQASKQTNKQTGRPPGEYTVATQSHSAAWNVPLFLSYSIESCTCLPPWKVNFIDWIFKVEDI